MNVGTLLEMVAGVAGDRVAVGGRHDGITYADLLARSDALAADLLDRGAARLALVDVASPAVPVGLFAAARAEVPFVPISYRLDDARLRRLLARTAPAAALLAEQALARVGELDGIDLLSPDEVLHPEVGRAPERLAVDPEAVAVLLYTSGTTGEPKAAVLRHRHLSAYVLNGVELLGAGPEEATLVSVPPYHVAGVSAVLTATYAGRRLVYLPQFDAHEWVRTVREQAITHAMVVPTMLGRILDVLDEEGGRDGPGLPSLRHLSYGGGRMPLPVVERALVLLAEVGFVNAYGLTETASTIAVLTPEDHRTPSKLASVGRPLPTVELEVRDPAGAPQPPGELGEIWVRGEQVAGEYLGRGVVRRDDGWLPTNDAGWLDDDGYLFVDGRLDDVIVRGAENLSPGAIEDVLLRHPKVAEAAVVGVADDEWGEVPAAFVVPAEGSDLAAVEVQDWVREHLRSSHVPAHVELRAALPYNETGKLLRRELRGSRPTP